MPRETNPQESAVSTATKETEYSYLSRGHVSTAVETAEDGFHHVVVQESAAPNDKPIPVIPSVHGDYYVPPQNAPVLVAPFGKNNYAVVGAPIPRTETPVVNPGERVISHPSSGANVKFSEDGTINIYGDETVKINGGTQGIITDIETTFSDGYVTSVTPVRDDNIKI